MLIKGAQKFETRVCCDARKVEQPLNGSNTRCIGTKPCSLRRGPYCSDRQVVPQLFHLDEDKIPQHSNGEGMVLILAAVAKKDAFVPLTGADGRQA